MGVLTDDRESDLLTILRGDQPWEEKRDALVAFTFAEPIEADPLSDARPPRLPNTFAEFRMAQADGLITFDQLMEVARLRDQQDAESGAADKPAEEPAADAE